MKLTIETASGASKLYEGPNGVAVLTKNLGNKDKGDRWQVSVSVNGKYKTLAKRANFEKAYAMAENEIG